MLKDVYMRLCMGQIKTEKMVLFTDILLDGLVRMIFSVQNMVRPLGSSNRLAYLTVNFFQMYHDWKYFYFLQILWLCLVFTCFKYVWVLNMKYSQHLYSGNPSLGNGRWTPPALEAVAIGRLPSNKHGKRNFFLWLPKWFSFPYKRCECPGS